MDQTDVTESLARAEARYEAELLDAQQDLGRWIPFADPSLLTLKAFAPLYELWDRITVKGEQVFALVSAPPRHTKTTTCFHGIARHLLTHPKHLVGYGTYNQDIAFQQSRLCRSIAARSGLWVSDERVEKDRFSLASSVSHWQTSAGGGGKFMPRGGSAIGLGFNVILVDDPIKNREEAESDVESEKTWQWILGSVLNRLEPGGSFILCHQRWNDSDPIGRFRERIEKGYADMPEDLRGLLPDVPWVNIELPAILDDGSPLVPERYSLLDLARIRVEVGEYNWHSQYQQQPRPTGERLFPEAFSHWVPDRDLAGRELGIEIEDGKWIPAPKGFPNKRLVLATDTATTESSTSDWTSLVLIAVDWEWDPFTERKELIADVLHVWRERLKSPDVVEFVAKIAKSVPTAALVYEVAGPGLVQAQFMERDHPEIVVNHVKTTTNKRLRAGSVANAAKRGRVRLPVAAPWLADFVRELKKFTGSGARKDDQVDALAHAWNFALTLQPSVPARTGGERPLATRGFGGF